MINVKSNGQVNLTTTTTAPTSGRAEALRALGLMAVAWVDGRYHYVSIPASTALPEAV